MVRAMIKETEMLSSATASISIWDEKELVRLYGREAILSYLTEETHND